MISCSSTSSSVGNYGCVSLSVSLALSEASVVWLESKNSPLSWHTRPIYDPSHWVEFSPASGLTAHCPQWTQDCENTEIPPAVLQRRCHSLICQMSLQTNHIISCWTLFYYFCLRDFCNTGPPHEAVQSIKRKLFTYRLCWYKLRRSLTIWDRLLGQPLMSSIFSLAEVREKEKAETEENTKMKTLSGRVWLIDPLLYNPLLFPLMCVCPRLFLDEWGEQRCSHWWLHSTAFPSHWDVKHYLVRANGSRAAGGPTTMGLLCFVFSKTACVCAVRHSSCPLEAQPTAAETWPSAHSWQLCQQLRLL